MRKIAISGSGKMTKQQRVMMTFCFLSRATTSQVTKLWRKGVLGHNQTQAISPPHPLSIPLRPQPPNPTPPLLDELRQDRCHVREGGNLLGGEKKTPNPPFPPIILSFLYLLYKGLRTASIIIIKIMVNTNKSSTFMRRSTLQTAFL